MRRAVIALLLLAFVVPAADAQLPEFEPPNWDLGWEVEDEPAIMELDSSSNFNLVLKFWIDNSRPVPGEFEVEVETYDGFEVDDPGKVDVAANANETFEIAITGSGMLDGVLHDASGAYFDVVKVTATLDVGDQVIDSKEIEKQIQFSSVFGFEIEFQSLVDGKGPEIKSGTSEKVDVKISNLGNVDDAIQEVSMSFRGCPQMNYDSSDSGIEQDVIISDSKIGSIILSAPSNHQDRICKFLLTVTSEGNGLSYTNELEFNVDGHSDTKSDNSEEENEESLPDNEPVGLEVEDNSLSANSSVMCVLIVTLAAVFRRK